MSPAKMRTFAPIGSISATARLSLVSSRPPITTEAHAFTSRIATSFPIPELPPVMIATLEEKLFMTVLNKKFNEKQ